MKKVFVILAVLSVLTACTSPEAQVPATSISLPTETPSTSTPELASAAPDVIPSVELSATSAPTGDFFTQTGITLPAPSCNGLTQSQTEGPYYKPDTPERNSLWEEGMQGTRLTLVGYVLDQNCQPLPNAWLDFWQADANGEYDNTGYRLRGHQFTDEHGRYYLETILPGLYASRPIEHIHVKVQLEGGEVLTSQLYFPERPIEGLTVTLEDRGNYFLGYFNFVVQR
jgi:protocatechuate 3,4-dioxygenase beta subunit